MQRITIISLFILFSTGIHAQELKLTPYSNGAYVNEQGYKISNFRVRATSSGCEGSQDYISTKDPTDKGNSPRKWEKAEKVQGGILCSDGSWYYGVTGPRAPEQPPGR